MLYVSIFLAANFVGDRALHFFYFQCSLGTLLIQLTFAGLIIFTEMVGFTKTAKILLYTCLFDLLIALLAYFIWGLTIPEFWVEQNIDSAETWRQIKIICLLSVSFYISALLMIKVASLVKKWLQGGWLFLRIFLVTLVGLGADMIFLMPILLLVAPSQYMAFWKMFSLLSIKSTLSFITIPAVYLFTLLLKSDPHNQE